MWSWIQAILPRLHMPTETGVDGCGLTGSSNNLAFQSNRLHRFRLAANPTRLYGQPGKERGRVSCEDVKVGTELLYAYVPCAMCIPIDCSFIHLFVLYSSLYLYCMLAHFVRFF